MRISPGYAHEPDAVTFEPRGNFGSLTALIVGPEAVPLDESGGLGHRFSGDDLGCELTCSMLGFLGYDFQ